MIEPVIPTSQVVSRHGRAARRAAPSGGHPISGRREPYPSTAECAERVPPTARPMVAAAAEDEVDGG
jgi:hypothetical protein